MNVKHFGIWIWSFVMFLMAGVTDGHALTAEAGSGRTHIVVEQNLPGLVPEMLDWWWGNIETSDRFVEWAPEHHRGFSWLERPSSADPLVVSPGSVQQWEEEIAGHVLVRQLTWLPRPKGPSLLEGTTTVRAKVAYPDYEAMLKPGRIRFDYRRNDQNDGVWIRTRYVLPAGIDEAYPGYREAIRSHITQSMLNLTGFLPDLFQAEYLEGALLRRGHYQITQTGWLLKRVVVDQEIRGITPDMLDWWWDNINSTQRYQRWHPTAHLSFQWRQAPSAVPIQQTSSSYSVGAVQLVSEYIGPYKSNLLITWLDPSEAAGKVEYERWIVAKTDLKELPGILPQRLIHEYQANEAGDGLVMRSTFTIPAFFDFIMPKFSRRLAEHAQQEMQFLPYFLPGLYEAEQREVTK